jgi:hypothetical protein
MDQETFANHISKLSKNHFDIACRMLLSDILNLSIINVDGKNDGGTDFSSFKTNGLRDPVAYQITTQKTDIEKKIWKDAKKSIDKLGITKFFFMCSSSVSEIELRKIEFEISQTFGIQVLCYDAKIIAGFILDKGLANVFLTKTNGLTHIKNIKSFHSYQESALYSYSVISSDSRKFKESIYDDTILFVLYHTKKAMITDVRIEVANLLNYPIDNFDLLIKSRVDSLMSKGKIITSDGYYYLDDKAKQDVEIRILLYENELNNLVSAQADILSEFKVEWDDTDLKNISYYIVSVYIQKQLENLKQVKVTMSFHPVFSNFSFNSVTEISSYLINNKQMGKPEAEKAVELIVENASTHPLITKLTRSAMFLALQSDSPSYSAVILGANRWSECNIIVEPSIAIPYICYSLFQNIANSKNKTAIQSVQRAIELDCKLFLPFFYIKECAGHLLEAKKYINIDFSKNEMQYSNNVFVSCYFYMKNNNFNAPDTLLDYLSVFSSSIRTEQSDYQQWVRSIMTDIQSILNRANIEFLNTPLYGHEECKVIEQNYSYYLLESKTDKRPHLIQHDIYALQYTNESILNYKEIWAILTYDNTLIKFGGQDWYKGWILSPLNFLDITQSNRKLSETNFVSLLHTFATFSERTLSLGARIMDKFIAYSSKEMQNWEYKQEVEVFKKQMIEEYSAFDSDISNDIDTKIEDFLKRHNIKLHTDGEEELSSEYISPVG